MSLLKDNNLSLSGACADVIPLTHVFQTDYGSENCPLQTVGAETSNTGIVSGDIVVATRGEDIYEISTSGLLWVKGKRTRVFSGNSYIFKIE